jgi:predicted RNA-binding Zn ribbon-like protein
MHTPRSIRTITFDGGCLCFDFINTVGSRFEETLREYLAEYRDVLVFAQRQEILPEQTLAQLSQYAQEHKKEAEEVRREIVAIRENMYQLFSAIANEEPVSQQVLETFNRDLSKGFSHLEFQLEKGNLQLEWRKDETDLYLPLRLALKSGYDILTKYEVKRMKECSGCGWLFLDQSKNNTRRWCDMQMCGSIDKSRRYYQRKKQQT